jgi:hypothetical protein
VSWDQWVEESGATGRFSLGAGRGLPVDIGRAFTFFLDDPEWVKKVLIAALVSLIPLVGSFILFGYALGITRSAYEGTDNRLPEWSDIGGFLVRGVVAWVGAFIWALPVILIMSCFIIAIAVAGGSEAAAIFLVFAAISFSFMAVIYLAIFLPVPIARYAIKDDFGAMFAFGDISVEIRRGLRPLLLALVIWIVASMVIAPLGILACFIGVYVTTALSYLMIGHAMGQAYREIDRPGMAVTRPPAF